METFFLFGISFLLTAALIPWVKKFSLRVGYIDNPDGGPLKVHVSPVPRSGGLALLGIFGLLMFILFGAGKVNGLNTFALLLGGGLVFGLGVYDDLRTLSPPSRLIGQALAGVILFLSGIRIETLFLISFPLTIFYVVGAINAINMEDGLDGLAGGMALLSALGFVLLSVQTGEDLKLFISSILSGVLIGFLFYNFNPASIFMGDNGSYFLGFVLAYLALGFTSLESLSTFFGPILIIGAPVVDAAYAILRRLKRRASPLTGDRSHFYDQFMQKGLTVRQTVLLCWAIQAVFVGAGVYIYFL
jgi:UDP-GlcNAc:undecaprenyl-phosphate GlcNAc-1-phosphate transferase